MAPERGGIPIPPPPVGAALDAAINEVLETMSDEQRAEPRFFPDNYPAWNEFFCRRYEWELVAYNGPPPPPARNNAADHRHWWSAPGLTLENMLTHIEGGNYPVLGMPLLPSLSRRRGSSWMPRRMASSGSVSSGLASRSASRSSAPPTRGHSSGTLIICEGARTSSPPMHGRKRKPRKEDAAAAAEAVRAEDAALREAIARSLVDFVPVDNSMPMDAVHWERERQSSSGSCWTWRPHGAAPPP
jgi:hypothetical protein